MRIIADSWLDEPQGQNIRDEGSSFSGGRAPQSRRLYAGMAITHYIRLPISSGVVAMGRGSAPQIFSARKKRKKQFAQVSE